jgi:hypothetical protein
LSALADVLGRDLGLRQPALEQQVTQVVEVEAVGLGVRLRPRSARVSAGSARRAAAPAAWSSLDDEAPASRGLKCRLRGLGVKAVEETPEALPVRRANPPVVNLAGLGVERVKRDLLGVDVEPNYDRRRGAPSSSVFHTNAAMTALELSGPTP